MLLFGTGIVINIDTEVNDINDAFIELNIQPIAILPANTLEINVEDIVVNPVNVKREIPLMSTVICSIF